RTSWKEVCEIIASSTIHTIKKFGPDRVVGFSPIPAMSMVSYAAGSRFLSLIGGTILSFYDWYADLPPASPQVWGDQSDVPESADWYDSKDFIIWERIYHKHVHLTLTLWLKLDIMEQK